MLRTTIHYLLLVLLTFALLPACRSVKKAVETGDYAEVIEITQRRLAGKENKDPDLVAALETAFNRQNDKDMAEANRLKARGQAVDWVRIHQLYRSIQQRQDGLTPLLPLTDKRGYTADFKFVRVDPLEREARENAAAQLYERGRELLTRGRAGDKAAAREAYDIFGRVGTYLPRYRDTETLRAEAESRGIVYVLVEARNETGSILPADFERVLLDFPVADMDSRWRRFHTRTVRDLIYDYRADLIVDGLQVSPEIYRERTYTDQREIVDGTDYVLDANGNVTKDSLGNDIKVPRRVTVAANVLEVEQRKTAVLSARYELVDLRTTNRVDTDGLSAEAVYENYAATFNGDRRALSRESLQRIGNEPGGYPTEGELVLQAANLLKNELQRRLAQSGRLI